MTLEELRQGNVVVLAGGDSAEREVSLDSGAAVAAAVREAGFSVAEVDPQMAGWIDQVQRADLVFIALHGEGGEDGRIQGMLDCLGIPYTGSGVLGSALAMDKRRSKELWQGIGVPTPDFVVLDASSDWQSLSAEMGPLFVKPAKEGSSIGMSRADNADELAAAYALASRHAGEVLAEKFVRGAEYTVGLLGERALPTIRLETDNRFYDYAAKYQSNETRYHCPAGLTEEQEVAIGHLALRAFQSLGCEVWGRADILCDEQGDFTVLEINTVPGMTSHSLVPMAAAATGLSMSELVSEIMRLSLKGEQSVAA